MEPIPLTALFPQGLDPTSYKVHFAVWNQTKQPIDVLATNQEEWQGWNSWRGVKDDFNREFSVAQDKRDPDAVALRRNLGGPGPQAGAARALLHGGAA